MQLPRWLIRFRLARAVHVLAGVIRRALSPARAPRTSLFPRSISRQIRFSSVEPRSAQARRAAHAHQGSQRCGTLRHLDGRTPPSSGIQSRTGRRGWSRSRPSPPRRARRADTGATGNEFGAMSLPLPVRRPTVCDGSTSSSAAHDRRKPSNTLAAVMALPPDCPQRRWVVPRRPPARRQRGKLRRDRPAVPVYLFWRTSPGHPADHRTCRQSGTGPVRLLLRRPAVPRRHRRCSRLPGPRRADGGHGS